MEKHSVPKSMTPPVPPSKRRKVLVIAGVFVYMLLLGYFVGAGLAQSLKPILH